jgi:N-acetylmuramoyl-L-alanine amidase
MGLPTPIRWRIALSVGILVSCAPGASMAVAEEPSIEISDACEPADFVVAVDAGHTRENPGAISARGEAEYSYNRRIAYELLDALHAAGFTRAFLINEDEDEISLKNRVREAEKGRADLLLSVHHDSVHPAYLETWKYGGQTLKYCDRYRGYSLLVSGDDREFEASYAFAERLGSELNAEELWPTQHHAEPIEGENKPLLDKERGIYRYDGLAVLRRSRMPSVLLECGVIVHRIEEQVLDRPSHRAAIVRAVVAAIEMTCADAAEGD